MVILNVKVGTETEFLYNTSVDADTDSVISDIVLLYNGQLKIGRICIEIEQLAKYGTMLPPEMVGLNEDQVKELGLKDEWGAVCEPMGGSTFNEDVYFRRNGKQPSEHMQGVLTKTVEEAKAVVSRKKAKAGVCLTQKDVQEALDMLRGATMIVYPMNLPPHDPIRMEFENKENLEGTQASKEVLDPVLARLWFSGKEIPRGKKLRDVIGRNEKTKITVKLTNAACGPPGREPIFTEEERKAMMLDAYRRQEELKVPGY
ncbi:cilia- and flagella-associated protein 298 isoform X3 [Rhodnius prolixus]|uniref:cilia- and flagella-associated protein 298 isoform X3 n=1 Tax=Rhodnius prolixus TaxID=13249 RepID=UPI003D18E0BA